MDRNGELWFIEAVRAVPPSTVLDVGANEGDWSEAALRLLPSAWVASFEPIPDIAARGGDHLRSFADRSNVVADGLAGASSDRTFFMIAIEPPFRGSGCPYTNRVVEQVDLPFSTGDEYCMQHGIDSIDLLKIDTEGADHLVLAGFRTGLQRGSIRVVQFEYGPWALANRYLLADHIDMLGASGYQVGKLYAEGVEFREHSTRHEDFRLANFVAVRRDDIEAIEAVRVR